MTRRLIPIFAAATAFSLILVARTVAWAARGTTAFPTELFGQYVVSAQGGAVETQEGFDDGHMDLAGFVTLNNNSGASAVNLTLGFQDLDEDYEGFTCVLSDPSDVRYTISGSPGVGTLVLTVGEGDTCLQGNDTYRPVDEIGKSITFNLYAVGGSATIASTQSSFFPAGNSNNEVVFGPTIAGTLTPVTGVRSSLSGPILISATGQTTDHDNDFGHLSLAGAANLNANGGADSLSLTLVYSDLASYFDAETCELTNPSDLTYSLSNGAGTLTISLSSQDNCFDTYTGYSILNSGNQLAFNLYAPLSGGSPVLVSTFSDIYNGVGDTIDDPGIVGTLTIPNLFSSRSP
jgi:hypothetical protein